MIDTLPSPDPITKEHSERVLAHIRHTILQEGPISFARFMQLALYTPRLGYYSAGTRKFGEAGDYVTAPEISPLFSRCIARQIAQILLDLAGSDILELGAGSGVMALEILRYLSEIKAPFEHYYILEVSADLRERQQQLLYQQAPQWLHKIEWLDCWPTTPINGAIIANEVIDAIPVHKFMIQNGPKEYFVTWKDERLQWLLAEPQHDELRKQIMALQIDFANGYESEINLMLPSWIASLADHLECGLALLIDYGFPRHEYYHPDRSTGTIMCHYHHRAHTNPLIYPGIQDITTHVDFTTVADAAADHGLTVSGFTHQAAFLLNCGITDFMMQAHDTITQYQLSQQIKRLTLPSEMGELFKVIALTKNYSESLLGFEKINQLERL